jgi:hypothetical protein
VPGTGASSSAGLVTRAAGLFTPEAALYRASGCDGLTPSSCWLRGLALAAAGLPVGSSESRILAVASASAVGVDSVLMCSPEPVVTVVVVVVVVTVVVTMFPVDGSFLTLVSDGSADCGLVEACSDVVLSEPP